MRRIERRLFLIASGSTLLATGNGWPQGSAQHRRIGLLFGSTKEGVTREMATLLSRLRELGYVPGQSVEIIPRFANGDPDRLPQLARELIEEGVEVVFVPNTQGAIALQQHSRRVPIIFLVSDPVRAGLIDSMAKPGRNATGFALGAITIAAKRVELLKDAFPTIKTVGLLFDPKYSASQDELAVVAKAAATLKIQLIQREASNLNQYLDAVERLEESGVDAYYVVYTGSSFAIRRELATAINRTRLPAMYCVGRFADDGGLMAYSWRTLNVSVLAAEYVDRILRGASPSDLPVQEPTVIELVVNLATAQKLARTISPSVLQRADRVVG